MNANKTKAQALMDRFPNLYISEYGIWIKRNWRDAEGTGIYFGQPELDNPDFGLLIRLNEEACKAVQDDWFFCSKCNTAHPKTKFKGQVFSGFYCENCYENHKSVQDLLKESTKRGFYE